MKDMDLVFGERAVGRAGVMSMKKRGKKLTALKATPAKNHFPCPLSKGSKVIWLKSSETITLCKFTKPTRA